MQKLIILIFISQLGCNGSDKVYLCNGPQSKVYHKASNCTGLNKCSTDIETTDIATAKAKQRRECGYCYY